MGVPETLIERSQTYETQIVLGSPGLFQMPMSNYVKPDRWVYGVGRSRVGFQVLPDPREHLPLACAFKFLMLDWGDARTPETQATI